METDDCGSMQGMTLSKISELADFKGREYRLSFYESTYSAVAWKCANADDISDSDWAAGVNDLGQFDSLCTGPSTVEVPDFQHGTYTFGPSEQEGVCDLNLQATGSDISQNIFDSTFSFSSMDDGSTFQIHAYVGDFTIFEMPFVIYSYAPTYSLVGDCALFERTYNQMFADGYGTSTCGSGLTGDVCAEVCATGCGASANCIAYYYGDQQNSYGTNAAGQCKWFFDTADHCKTVSAPNSYDSGGHPAYGDYEAMTNLFCGDDSRRSGAWGSADDQECTANSREGYELYKKTGRGY